MKRKSKNKKLTLILVLILLISVGYAALASNLKINGSSSVKSASWNVYWDNVVPTTGGNTTVTTPARIKAGTNSTEVEYAVTLNEPGDYYEFTVDAVNNGTIDAMIAANGIVNGVYSDSSYTTPATLPKSVSYTLTYADGKPIADKHLLAKKSGNTATRETYKVRIEYRNDDEIDEDDLDENDQTYYFKFSVNYVQADNTATESHPSAITYVTRQNEGQITPGDVIKIGDTENFYVISSDAQKTVLLAKYNLLVGNIVENGEVTGTIPSSTAGYGLQSSEATGYPDELSSNYKGTVAFSSTNYWDDGNGTLLSPYNANGAGYVNVDVETGDYILPQNYPYVYDINSNIYQYISGNGGYVDKLKEMGAPSTIKGRLLKYEEAVNAQSIQDNGTSIILDGHQSYWFGSAFRDFSVWIARFDGYNDYEASYVSDNCAGVRPVIEIPTSEIR